MPRPPGYARLLAAQTISPLGDAMAVTALILHVLATRGTPASVGLLLFVQALPPLAAPVAGVVADRVRPGRLLGGGLAVQGALVGVLAVWLPSFAPMLGLVFLVALVQTPLDAAVGRSIAAVVADTDLPGANALRGGLREVGTVVGPPLAGLLFALDGARLVLAIDALTFLVAVPLVWRLPHRAGADDEDDEAGTAGATRPTVRRDIAEGLAFVWRTPVVRAVAVGFWTVVFLSAADDLVLSFLATETFGGGPVAVGMLLAAAALGLLFGLPLVAPAGRRLGVTGAIVAGFAVMSLGNLLTAAAPWLAAAFAAQVLRGLTIPMADAFVTTHLQRTAPPRLLGRALANVYGGVGVAAASGYLLGAPVLEATSPRVAFVVIGAGGLGGAALTALLLARTRRP